MITTQVAVLFDFIKPDQSAESSLHFDRTRGLQRLESELIKLEPPQLSEIFCACAFLSSACETLRDELWLQAEKNQNKQDQAVKSQLSFNDFTQNLFSNSAPFAPIAGLQPLFVNVDRTRLTTMKKNCDVLIDAIVNRVRNLKDDFAYREFLSTAVREMDAMVQFEDKREQNSNFAFSLYRSFDSFDQILGLDYERDQDMANVPDNSERLYEGAGVGVQSSYATLLIALGKLRPKNAARLIDLGSGYGRVGLITGLMRPDIEFIGYEYVSHRVENSNAAAVHSGIADKVVFHTQDLANRNFSIPDADIYYVYDSFSDQTYQYVFAQLKEIGARIPITVVTKGNAGAWFENASAGVWSAPEKHDTGALEIFYSIPNTQRP